MYPCRLFVAIALVVAFSPLALAEEYAFLVGVRQYDKSELSPLKYTENDVHQLASTLAKNGVPQKNIMLMSQKLAAQDARRFPNAANISHEFDLLVSELGKDDSIIVGFSGHGVQFQGSDINYFCPIDARLGDKSTLIDLTKVYQRLERSPAKSKLLLVDASRNDPESAFGLTARKVNLEPVTPRKPPVLEGGMVAIFSCSASQQAFESPELKSGVFFHFVNRAFAGEADQNADKVIDLLELQSFTIKGVQTWTRVNLGVKQTPEQKGRGFGSMALVRLDRASAPKSFVNSTGMKLILIPAGEFMMGSPPSEKDRNDNELQHRVRISEPFYLGATEVTQGQWQAVMGTTPWKGESYVKEGGDYFVKEGGDYAATHVSWEDAVEFCKRLSVREGREYSLPTEAQWEYACRGGTTTMYSFGDDASQLSDYAWWGGFFGNGNAKNERYAHQVGQKRPNAFGLFDMHGNVYEWCSDWYGEDYYGKSPSVEPAGPAIGASRVLRGGSWFNIPQFCRSAIRNRFTPAYRDIHLGFRVQVPSVE